MIVFAATDDSSNKFISTLPALFGSYFTAVKLVLLATFVTTPTFPPCISITSPTRNSFATSLPPVPSNKVTSGSASNKPVNATLVFAASLTEPSADISVFALSGKHMLTFKLFPMLPGYFEQKLIPSLPVLSKFFS